MQFGLNLPAFGEYSDPRYLADIAKEAEDAGWDGFFIWDHMIFDPSWHPIGDTWVGLAAVALNTSRVRIGPLLTPLPRRRPWKLSREVVGVDQLSNGRLILGVGIGDPVQWEFGFFGEETDAKRRAGQLDEGLEILMGLWTGEMFGYEGKHYQLQPMRWRPRPVQTPRVPIWVGGNWPNKPPFRRAARWEGVIPIFREGENTEQHWREMIAYVKQHRTSDEPYDIVLSGQTSGANTADDQATIAKAAAVGATWWIESVDPWRFGQDWENQWSSEYTALMNERIRQGPPKPPSAGGAS
jgi:alkanesulfonate monooxygenase SsuD/methylene tetrahydromethanopterin reductase-like flavin-dependent oxidoreductase (luciferase family)